MAEEQNEDVELDEEERSATTDEIEQAFQSDDMLTIEKMLVRLTYHDPDWQRATRYALEYADHPTASIRGVAIDCMRRLLYTHTDLDPYQLLPVLYRHRADPSKYVARSVGLALSAIEQARHIPVQPVENVPDHGDPQ